MANLKGLTAALNEWLDKDDSLLRGDARLYTKEEWNDRGEEYGKKADLTLTIDGSPLYRALNYGEPDWSYMEALNALAKRYGYYYEQGYAWTVHFYKV
jgi:hypothetical protein